MKKGDKIKMTDVTFLRRDKHYKIGDKATIIDEHSHGLGLYKIMMFDGLEQTASLNRFKKI